MKSIYSKSKKLILVIFLGLYYYTIEKFTIFIVNDVVTTILLSSILLPFATSKYINISNNNDTNINNNNNNTSSNNIDLTSLFTNVIENSTIINEKYDIYKKYNIQNRKNNRKIRNSSRYKRNNIWTTTTDSTIRINDFRLIKNESIELQSTKDSSSKYNLTTSNNQNNNNNYYYEEQKPLIIIPSESGSIAITDYTGTVKPLSMLSSTSDSVTNTEYDDDDDDYDGRNFDRNNNHFYDNSENDNRNKYVVTTSTASPSGISDLSSKEMDEYADNYQNDDNYYNRQNYNDEIENDNSYDDNRPKFNSYMETVKNVWDIFTAINAAWSSITAKQQTNNNSNNRKFNENSTESITTISDYQQQQQNNEKYIDDRLKRNTNYTNNNYFYKSIELPDIKTDIVHSSTDLAIAEGRYIKGDPLKGYYDFVITEGSYKFWAAFQFATAILIIYSTFAAIYYSKVNPLVGDYDYVDYLGGGRSLTNNINNNDDDDTDFIDLPYSESRPKSSNNNMNSKSFLSSIAETASNSGDWIPRMGHTLKFILDAIDKIPQ